MNIQTIKYQKIIFLLLILLTISISLTWHIYLKSKKEHAKSAKTAPTKSIRTNPKQNLLSELDKRLVLPKGYPIIFNLSDLANLTNQPFFNASKPTDKLILFQEEKKAVLYDPLAKQIINIGPLVIVPATPEAQISEAK